MTDWDDFPSGAIALNWITPGIAFLQDLMAGPVAHFGVVATGGYYKRDIKRLLNRSGIQSWGYMYGLDFETLSFSVRKSDAKRAYFVLRQAGVPLDSVPEAAVDVPRRRGLFE